MLIPFYAANSFTVINLSFIFESFVQRAIQFMQVMAILIYW